MLLLNVVLAVQLSSPCSRPTCTESARPPQGGGSGAGWRWDSREGAQEKRSLVCAVRWRHLRRRRALDCRCPAEPARCSTRRKRRPGSATRAGAAWISRGFGEIVHHTGGCQQVRPATTSQAHSTFIVLRAGWREPAKMKFSWRERKPAAAIFSMKEKGRCHLLVSA
jgi:hypothetical protein